MLKRTVSGLFILVLVYAVLAFSHIPAVILSATAALCLSAIYEILYSVLASVICQFGDLSMSVIKRVCGIKDYGQIFPGHGGVLDRFDSHMFSVAFTLAFCTLTGGFIL